jgi:3-methyl-2-oxobutanoate hydroxymethyltransferase
LPVKLINISEDGTRNLSYQIIVSYDSIIMSLGSGPHAHGQLLIYHDMFGLYPRFKPRMAKVFGNAGEVILNGLTQYVQEVSDQSFPQPENWFTMKDEEYEELMGML